MPLRIRAIAQDASTLSLRPTQPDTWKLRRDPKTGYYWMDMQIVPRRVPARATATLVVGCWRWSERERCEYG